LRDLSGAPGKTAPSTKRSAGVTFRPVNACATAIRAIMTMPPFSAAFSNNPLVELMVVP
jgi:hypothetical protein